MTSKDDTARVQPCSLDQLRSALGDLRGKRVTLMGLGVFGGGEGAARFLLSRGAELIITDLRPAGKLARSLRRLAGAPVTLHLGEHLPEDFVEAELVVANPAVRRTSPFLRMAQRAGVPITSPMNMFLASCSTCTCAVTGSNGKSTTASLLAAMLQSAGRTVWLGGNIGISLLPSLSRIGPEDLVVLELSSFQLEDARALRWSPHVTVVTNVTPNHLDRHGGFDDYAMAKRAIVDFQVPGDFAVLCARDPILEGWARDGVRSNVVFFDAEPEPGRIRHGVSLMGGRLVWHNSQRSDVICLRDDVPLLGLHNTMNAMAAAAAARCLGVGSHHVRRALSGFVGLEHRLELVGQFRGVRVYNDSYSTTPESSVAALKSFRGAIALIAGGCDKGLNLGPLARTAAQLAEVLITVGEAGPLLAQKAREESAYLGRSIVIQEVGDLQGAVRAAARLSMPGSVVVFSPGCASYDMFDNYEQRGRVFKNLVRSDFRR